MPRFGKAHARACAADDLDGDGALGPAAALNLPIEVVPISELRPNPRNARKHSKKQIQQLAASFSEFGITSLIAVGPDNMVLAGHGRLEAAKLLGLSQVRVVRLDHLTEAQRKAFALADNRLGDLSTFDHDLLAAELREIVSLDQEYTLELSGYDGAELDLLLDGPIAAKLDAVADRQPEAAGPAISQRGDIWLCGGHRLACGDARDPEVYARLMPGERARMVFTDVPYNVAIDGNVGGKGKVARREFVMASGEMSRDEFTAFLMESHRRMTEVSLDGAIHFSCIDWRHVGEMSAVGDAVYSELKNIIVWVKDNAGMGSFYRSQHEFIFAFKYGSAPHVNNFKLGETGRYRSNCWSYPGVNGFGRGRDEALAMHPTVKNVAMVADAIRDVSRRGEIVLDPFAGSGTTMIAAEKTGRKARLIELDPLYCDAVCRRWAQYSGAAAVLEASSKSFEDVCIERGKVKDDE